MSRVDRIFKRNKQAMFKKSIKRYLRTSNKFYKYLQEKWKCTGENTMCQECGEDKEKVFSALIDFQDGGEPLMAKDICPKCIMGLEKEAMSLANKGMDLRQLWGSEDKQLKEQAPGLDVDKREIAEG